MANCQPVRIQSISRIDGAGVIDTPGIGHQGVAAGRMHTNPENAPGRDSPTTGSGWGIMQPRSLVLRDNGASDAQIQDLR